MPEFLKNSLVMLVSLLLAYAVAEVAYSYLYRHGHIDRVRDGWFFLEAGQTIHFDPEIGYRLTRHPCPNLRVTMGEVEYEGVFQGNNRGFQDRQDFYPERPADQPYRVAILGDSFATGQFLHTNWPDRVEERDRRSPAGRRLELLNFSLYSGGLVNWRNIVRYEIERHGYALDLLVIPVFANDLFRPFMAFDAQDTRKLLIGRAGFDPDQLPQSLEAFRVCCASESDGYILDRAEWQRLRESGWHPELPRPDKRYLAEHAGFLLAMLQHRLQAWRSGSTTPPPLPAAGGAYQPDPQLGRGQLGPEQWRLIGDIRAYVERQKVPVLVVRIPDRDELAHTSPVAGNVFDLAEALGAPVLDGAQAFAGLAESARRDQYYPYDGHWNQGGSDRFADFMLAQLRERAQASAVPPPP